METKHWAACVQNHFSNPFILHECGCISAGKLAAEAW